jgi:hypothetical protein
MSRASYVARPVFATTPGRLVSQSVSPEAHAQRVPESIVATKKRQIRERLEPSFLKRVPDVKGDRGSVEDEPVKCPGSHAPGGATRQKRHFPDRSPDSTHTVCPTRRFALARVVELADMRAPSSSNGTRLPKYPLISAASPRRSRRPALRATEAPGFPGGPVRDARSAEWERMTAVSLAHMDHGVMR